MKINKLFLLFFFIFNLYGCAEYKTNKINKLDKKNYFSSSGFALIYEAELYEQKIINKKIKNDESIILHNLLKRGTLIRITNPSNLKIFDAKVNYKSTYPEIFNVVISKKIATFLELDINNPFVEINEIKKNKTFIAKEGSIFEEEINVADKAPVDEIKMDDLTLNKSKNIKKKTKKDSFIIVISDFYYVDSANNLKKELIKKTNNSNFSVKKINDNKYRLLVGPFKNFSSLKTTYISLNNLGFENLNIYKN